MDKVIVDKWIAALRSGEYDQGNGKLKPGGCFGVLCDIAVKEGVISSRVQDWAGMWTNSGSLGETSLVSMNDSGTPFLEIADTIEKDYETL